MEELRQWVYTVCCGTLLCGAVSALLPGEGNRKLMDLVLGLFMLCCFLLPAGLSLELPEPDLAAAEEARSRAAGELEEYFLTDTLRRSEEELERRAGEVLAGYGINAGSLSIYMETDESEDDGAWEPVVELTLPEEARELHGELTRVLEYELGATVRLGYAGEGA